MKLQPQERKELITCMNERIKSRAEMIQQTIDFFKDLKSSGRKWEIKLKIGKFNIIEIEKPEYTREKAKYHKYLTWLNHAEKPDYDGYELNRMLDIDLFTMDKNGWRNYTGRKKFHELDYLDFVEFIDNLDNILVNIALIDNCRISTPIMGDIPPPSPPPNDDMIKTKTRDEEDES